MGPQNQSKKPYKQLITSSIRSLRGKSQTYNSAIEKLACSFPNSVCDWLSKQKIIELNNAPALKTIRTTGYENESKYRSRRGTGLLRPLCQGPDMRFPSKSQLSVNTEVVNTRHVKFIRIYIRDRRIWDMHTSPNAGWKMASDSKVKFTEADIKSFIKEQRNAM